MCSIVSYRALPRNTVAVKYDAAAMTAASYSVRVAKGTASP